MSQTDMEIDSPGLVGRSFDLNLPTMPLDQVEIEGGGEAHVTVAGARFGTNRCWLWLVTSLLLTSAAVLVSGYHLGADDAEVYLPGIKRVFDPQLYPFNAQFFMAHSGLSIFAWLVGGSARLLHLPIDVAILLWQIVSIFLLLVAAWRLATLCFVETVARWSAVMLLAVTLAVPVAGTALPIMDPYLDSRSLSTPLTLLAVGSYFQGRKKSAAACLAVTALVHPQMAIFGIGFLLLTETEGWLTRQIRARRMGDKDPVLCFAQDEQAGLGSSISGRDEAGETSSIYFARVPHHTRELWAGVLATLLALLTMLTVPLALPKMFPTNAAQGAYREVLYSRPFFFVLSWRWWEWIGVLAPLAILYGFGRRAPRSALPPFHRIVSALIRFAILSSIYAVILSSTHHFDYWVRLQPMRSFQLVYVFLFLFLGGALGEWVLKTRMLRWLALFLPLGLGMYLLTRQEYPRSPHVEWPTRQPTENPWLDAFFWVREYTPKDALFALDPQYMRRDDQHGFRAVAERSALADSLKDSGAASVFPDLATEWERQQEAQAGWKHFRVADFDRLREQYGVNWLVVEHPPAGLECPYQNAEVKVCRLGPTHDSK